MDPTTATQFRYLGLDIDEGEGRLHSRYAIDDTEFVERIGVDDAPTEWSAAAREAARLVYLLAGISYYKAAAPPVIDLGDTPVRPGEIEFLRHYHIEGLGEYAYRNDLDLTGIEIVGGVAAGPPAVTDLPEGFPMVPFGGGIDSIVSVAEVTRVLPDAALFVVSRAGDRFDPIEQAAAVTGLPVLRADRELDPKILRSRELGYRNGHVPVTAILSSIAVLTAVLHGRDQVVMSNEWSSSIGNVDVDGRSVNHQFSKSMAFESAFRDVLAGAFTRPPEWFSMLRDRSELWVALRFAGLEAFHDVFRSCNRAFHIDPAQRADRWCGECDKCAFIDLILSPYLPAATLQRIFDGREPLANPALQPTFETLVGLGPELKPWECVGDIGECRAALVLAADRTDRAEEGMLQALRPRVEVDPAATDRLLEPMGPSFVPAVYAQGG